jgi:hypothetical protein
MPTGFGSLIMLRLHSVLGFLTHSHSHVRDPRMMSGGKRQSRQGAMVQSEN